MNKIAKEFLNYIEKVGTTYLRNDKISKFDTDDEFNNSINLFASGVLAMFFIDCPNYTTISKESDELGSPRIYGCLQFDKFEVNVYVDPFMYYRDNSFWIESENEFTFDRTEKNVTRIIHSTKPYKPSEHFDVLFF